MPEKDMMGDLHFEEAGGDEEDLPPRYSSIHPQHLARVQAWREEHASCRRFDDINKLTKFSVWNLSSGGASRLSNIQAGVGRTIFNTIFKNIL